MFDAEQFIHDIPPIVRMMDNVVDVSRFPLPAQEQEAKNKRRIGLGVTGLADALALGGVVYGSDEAVEWTNDIMQLIAETAYPFTFAWNDWTNNIIGDSSQILPQFSASIQGQKDYLNKIKYIISNTPNGIGFAYWGAEFISFKGSEAKNGSSWENQALWDFTNKALPSMSVFNE